MSDVAVGPLDSPGACTRVLSDVNQNVAEFEWQWARAAGEVERLTKAFRKAHERAQLDLGESEETFKKDRGRPPTVAEREALANLIVDELYPDLRNDLAEAEATVAECVARFKVQDRLGNNAQSALASMREQARRDQFEPSEGAYA